ncbi:sulfite exporter TauE/SafE family protein [Duodenibacillus massiliensis]|uniref:sulfite exporter TauE/SafE family protein n=1 Tax=Duodenibacillus massiliensis TaxID=1852381 RepID=UPI003AF185CC
MSLELIAALLVLGACTGYLAGLLGIGGGFISVPFMVWCNVPMHKAVGTSAALGFPIAFAGTLSYIWAGWGNPELAGTEHMLGYIHWPALLSVAAMSVLTAPLGAKTAHSIDTKPLKRIFACLLLCLATYMLVRAFI